MPIKKGSTIKSSMARDVEAAYTAVDNLAPQNGGSMANMRNTNSKDTRNIVKASVGQASGPITRNL